MAITIAGQTWVFLGAIVLGAALGVCYDVFRILRVALPHPAAVIAAEDILFALICAAATFLYQLSADCGRIRIFVLVGELAGFSLYYCTVGALVLRISKGIIHVIRVIFGWLWKIFVRPILKLLEKLRGFAGTGASICAKYLNIGTKNTNTHLKKHSRILYNLKKRLHRETTRQKKGKTGSVG